MKQKEKMMKFKFTGTVLKYDTPICQEWSAETTAPTPQKALANLKFRFRKAYGLVAAIPIALVGALEVIQM